MPRSSNRSATRPAAAGPRQAIKNSPSKEKTVMPEITRSLRCQFFARSRTNWRVELLVLRFGQGTALPHGLGQPA